MLQHPLKQPDHRYSFSCWHAQSNHQLTRADTPDSVRRSLHRFASALRQKAALCNLLLPFPCKPASLGFAWSAQSIFCHFRLDGRQPACVSKNKNHTKIQSCQVRSSFAGAEMRPGNEKPAGNTLCIVLKRHGRFSARQNRVCPCQLMVMLFMTSAERASSE